MVDPSAFSRQRYLAWVEERIEEHKSNLTRDELLALADEAVNELIAPHHAQYPLTEILLLDAVNELIFRRLGLPSYRRWVRLCQQDTAKRPPGATRGGSAETA